MKKTIRIIAGSLAVVLILMILFFANGILGNPISQKIAESKAEKYIEATYPTLELQHEKAKYDFKLGRYSINVISPTSIDTKFVLEYSHFGELKNDSFQWAVNGKHNTWERVNNQYSNQVDQVVKSGDFPIKSVDFSYGSIERDEENNTFELDKEYDLYELGKSNGCITIRIRSDIVDVRVVKEILLKIKGAFDSKGVSFCKINFTLRNISVDTTLKPDDYEEFYVMDLLYTEIYEENFEERLIKEEEITKKKLAVLDAQKQAEIDAYQSAVKEQTDK